MSSSVSPKEDHDFRAMHHSQYSFSKFVGLEKSPKQRPRPVLAPRRVKDDRLHQRHESHPTSVSSQILDLVSTSLLPKQSSGCLSRDNDGHSLTQLPRVSPNAEPHVGSRNFGRHMSQLSLSGFELPADKQRLHIRHQSLVSRQRFLRSSNRLVSPSSLVAMQDQPVPPSDTRISVHDDHDGFATEKYTPLLGTQSSHSPSTPTHRSLAFWLILYFCFNLGLTLYNKCVLIHFPFPYTLTALHALCGTFGGLILLKNGAFVPAKLSDADNLALVAFSGLYTINIAVSNVSLQLVNIPFHQVVRAGTPIFTIMLSMFLFGTRCSNHKMASLVPVMAGVGFATYGDYSYTNTGLILTVLGTVLAAIKTIYTSILQSKPSLTSPRPRVNFVVPPRLQLHPLDLLTRMAPLAFIQCVILAHLTGELSRVRTWSSLEMTPVKAALLGVNGMIACGLNIVSFTANRAAGPLSMTVAANVKQVLSVFLAVIIFKLTITPTNALGILLTLAGGTWYAAVEYKEKRGSWRK